MTYLPLFRVRSGNYGMRCMSFYIFTITFRAVTSFSVKAAESVSWLWLTHNSPRLLFSDNPAAKAVRSVLPILSHLKKVTIKYMNTLKPEQNGPPHYSDVITSAMVCLITGVSMVYSTDQRKYQSSPSLAFMRGIHRWPVNSPHKGPVMWKIFLFSCLRLRQWPVTYLITLSDWIMSCQPGRHAVVTVCEPDWKHKWAAYKSFDETSSFNNL